LTSAERPKPGAGDRRFLGREDVKRLLDAPPERYRVAIACGFFSGLRLSALLGLTWADIDLRDATIHVRMQTGRNGRSTIARS
jgi:integrase